MYTSEARGSVVVYICETSRLQSECRCSQSVVRVTTGAVVVLYIVHGEHNGKSILKRLKLVDTLT